MTKQSLTTQAMTRLRRIEGQVRGLQAMLERIPDDPVARKALSERVGELLALGRRQKEIARDLKISHERVAGIVKGTPLSKSEPCGSLLTQILAVRAAVEQVGLLIMELHLQRCVLGDVVDDEDRLRGLHDSLKMWSRLSASQ